MGAASFLHGHRFSRPAAMKQYLDWVLGLGAAPEAQAGTDAALASQVGPGDADEMMMWG